MRNFFRQHEDGLLCLIGIFSIQLIGFAENLGRFGFTGPAAALSAKVFSITGGLVLLIVIWRCFFDRSLPDEVAHRVHQGQIDGNADWRQLPSAPTISAVHENLQPGAMGGGSVHLIEVEGILQPGGGGSAPVLSGNRDYKIAVHLPAHFSDEQRLASAQMVKGLFASHYPSVDARVTLDFAPSGGTAFSSRTI